MRGYPGRCWAGESKEQKINEDEKTGHGRSPEAEQQIDHKEQN